MLAQIKPLVIKSARSWYIGLLGEEINTFEDFKCYFKRQYYRTEKAHDEYLSICTLLCKGLIGISVEDYIFLIKGKNKTLKWDLDILKEGICKHLDTRDHEHILNANNLLEMAENSRKYDIRVKIYNKQLIGSNKNNMQPKSKTEQTNI